MANRKDRRKNLHQQQPSKTTAPVVAQVEETVAVPEPGAPFPPLSSLSPGRLAANRANAQLSTGPNPESFPTTSQNRTTHGLARHTNGIFKLTDNEDPAGFEAFKQSLIDEHLPTTTTESILVDAMAESLGSANAPSAFRTPASTPPPEPSPTKRNSPYVSATKPPTPAPSTSRSTTSSNSAPRNAKPSVASKRSASKLKNTR